MDRHKVYLGDGVYADTDGYHVILTTENGIHVTNTIYLDSLTIEAFERYVAMLRNQKNESV